MNRTAPFLLPLAALAVAGLAACGSDADGDSDASLEVMGSTTIISDLIEQVGGEHVSVESVVPRASDVHTFSMSPADIRKLDSADLVFIAGASLESGFQAEIEQNASTVITLSDSMQLEAFPAGFAHDHGAEGDDHAHEEDDGHEHEDGDDHAHDEGDGHEHDDAEDDAHGDEAEDHSHDEDDHGHSHGPEDPHFWMDIDLTISAVNTIAASLGEADPDHADAYTGNAAAYITELQALDTEIADQLSALPENRRYLVTFHDAYGYFANRYGLTILGFVVESPEEEPAAGDYSDLVVQVEEFGVPYIFVEPQFDARVVEELASETGAEVRALPNDTLTDDYPTYIDLMREMANAIAE